MGRNDKMGRIRRRNKTVTVTRKATSRGIPNFIKPNAVVSGEIKERWDIKNTLMTNYTKMGLVSNIKTLNVKAVRPIHARAKVDPIEFNTGEVCPQKERKNCSEGEAEVVEALIERHGDDYGAMARDHKINTYQHTARQLRQKVERYQRQAEREAAKLEKS